MNLFISFLESFSIRSIFLLSVSFFDPYSLCCVPCHLSEFCFSLTLLRYVFEILALCLFLIPLTMYRYCLQYLYFHVLYFSTIILCFLITFILLISFHPFCLSFIPSTCIQFFLCSWCGFYIPLSPSFPCSPR